MEPDVLQKTLSEALAKHFGSLGEDVSKIVEEKLAAKLAEKGLDKVDFINKKFPGMGGDEDQTVSKKAVCAKFFRALAGKDMAYLASLKTMSENVDSAGGFLVPEEVAAELDRVTNNYGLIRKLARHIPMSRDIFNMPTLGTVPTVTWPGEGTAGTDGSPVLSNVKMQAKTCIGLSPVTNELLADANQSVVDMLMELFAEALAGEEDNQAFNGTGSPFLGILQSSDVSVVTAASASTFATVTLNDYRECIAQIGETALPGCVWVFNKAVWALIQEQLQNSQNVGTFQNPLVTTEAPKGGLLIPAGYLWGYPVYTSDKMISTTAVSTKFGIFGNFKHFYFGDRQQVSMDISKEATVGSVNAFASNHSIVRVMQRVALAIGVPAAFAVIKTHS